MKYTPAVVLCAILGALLFSHAQGLGSIVGTAASSLGAIQQASDPRIGQLALQLFF
jgi:hypothetical protein